MNTLVSKRNDLIRSKYNLTLHETRLYLLVLIQIDRKQGFQPFYRVNIRDYKKAIGSNSNSIHQELKEAVKSLKKRDVFIPKEDGGWIQANWISSGEFFPKQGYIEIEVSRKLEKHLFELQERITEYDIRYALRLGRAHAVRIYEILKYVQQGEKDEAGVEGTEITLSLEEFRELLGIENQYKVYNRLKERVILPAQKELKEKCDITFEFQEIKEGRKVVKIRFVIIPVAANTLAEPLFAELDQPEGREDVVAAIQYFGIKEKKARELAAKLAPEVIFHTINYVKQQHKKGKVKSSISGYLIKTLEKGGIEPSPFEQDAIKKEQTQGKTSSQRKQEKLKALEETQIIAQLEQEFDAYRESKAEQMLKELSEEDWQQFEAYVRENAYISNRLLRANKIDREDENTLFYLRVFFSNRLPEKQTAFIDWANRKHGYNLVLQKDRGEEVYKIVGKQSELF